MTGVFKKNKPTVKANKRTSDFCVQYGVTPITIWRWVRDRRLEPPLKINGRNYWPADAEPLSDDEVA